PIVPSASTSASGPPTLERSTWNTNATTGTTTSSTASTKEKTPIAFPRKIAPRESGETSKPTKQPSSRSRCQVRPIAITLAKATASQIVPGATRTSLAAPAYDSAAMSATSTPKNPAVVM